MAPDGNQLAFASRACHGTFRPSKQYQQTHFSNTLDHDTPVRYGDCILHTSTFRPQPSHHGSFSVLGFISMNVKKPLPPPLDDCAWMDDQQQMHIDLPKFMRKLGYKVTAENAIKVMARIQAELPHIPTRINS